MNKVIILGCGPAGLFAAHAAVGQGMDVRILSKPRKSFMRGAQYLHRPIPGLSREPFKVDYRLEGSVEGYRDKVYGDVTDVQVSPETLTGIADAWDIREAYEAAWAEYNSLIEPWDVTQRDPYDLYPQCDLVVSTIPAKLLCHNPRHEFVSQMIWSTDFIRYTGAFTNDLTGRIEDNIVVCSGDPEDWWYRISRIHGWENTEYPHRFKPDTDRVWEVEKPISNNCTCHSKMLRLGRYGAWKKGILSDSAFYEMEELLLMDEEAREDDLFLRWKATAGLGITE